MIVIVSHPQDPHALRVRDLLIADGHGVLLLDLSDLPHRSSISIDYRNGGIGRIDYSQEGLGRFNLAEARSAWWRRPQAPDLSQLAQNDVYAFTQNEWQEATNGLWQLLDVPWMNPPAKDEVAGRKALQLKIAAGLGLRIPRTLITSDPAAAREFIAAEGLGNTVFKTFSCTHAIWRETRLVGERELELIGDVRFAPVIFQEYVRGAVDLRVTIIGQKIFAAAIHSKDTDYPTDFRMSLGQARTEAVELPPPLCDRLLSFMRQFGLVYGAIDLRRTADGAYFFLEVNTAGEFLFIEERTGQPIARALADWLATPRDK